MNEPTERARDYDFVADAIDPFIRGNPPFDVRCEIRRKLVDYIAAARAEERARCVKVIETNTHPFPTKFEPGCEVCEAVRRIAAKIRSGE